MRVFWILLSLIITGSGIAVFMPQGDRPDATVVTISSESASTPTDTYTAPSVITEAPAAQIAEQETSEEVAAVAVEDAALETADSSDAGVTETIEESAATEVADAGKTEAETEAATNETTEEVNGWAALAEQANSSDAATTTETNETNTGAEAAAEAETDAAPAPMTISRNEDGSLSIGDGKYTITGAGTKENPYLLPWEYFVSIQEYYNPREGRKAIPGHIAMFDGAYVSIAGYLQFPLATPEPTECLVMLNQWDGCCIGVPPTPYDAIEVTLSEPATRAQKFAVEGRIVGKLKIDPYLVGNWLIGLYLLGDASVDVSGSRSAEEVYGNTPSQLIPHED
ncbi:MAG: hypothetical protein ED559_05805 [Phycisphaera sp.]|nr:MAG: hypothetical protein ED559_05805 [Phycisphaera sp.]